MECFLEWENCHFKNFQGDLSITKLFVRIRFSSSPTLTNFLVLRTHQRTVIVMIVLNSMSIALSTMDWVTEYPIRKLTFSIANAVFLILFTLELLLRFLYAGPLFFVDGWCIFDLLVISSSWIVYPLLALRCFRLVRSLRLATRVKDLQYMAQALLASVPKMLALQFLLALQFYVWTIIFTYLFKNTYKDGYTSQDYFGRLDTTSFTLFQIMTLDRYVKN